MVDSEANICVTSKEVAAHYEVAIKKPKKQGYVQFGKQGSRSTIQGYGIFGEYYKENGNNRRRK